VRRVSANAQLILLAMIALSTSEVCFAPETCIDRNVTGGTSGAASESTSNNGGTPVALYIFIPVGILAVVSVAVCAFVWYKRRQAAPGFNELDLLEDDSLAAAEVNDEEENN
jgi:hypothetical protein